MKPLKIALICKNEGSTKRNDRNMGYFSYDVPEFTWEHFVLNKHFTIDLKEFTKAGFDLVFHEDYPYGKVIKSNIPYVFLSIDSTLSKDHYQDRFKQSKQADLILVDHDNIGNFQFGGINTYQFPYCVNDKIFFRDDRERTVDIAYHCSSSAHAGITERKRIRQLLHDLSVKHNWVYKSGVMGLHEYAESFRTAKIVVNQSRTPTNRPHRIFDAMACGAMVLSSPLPQIDQDNLNYDKDEVNYYPFYGDLDLEMSLLMFFDNPSAIMDYSNNGYNMVMQNHTWSIRATQLREIINKEFGI